MKNEITIAMIQDCPVHLDLARSMDKTLTLLAQAAAQGAELVVFGETWLTGYPAWIDYCPDVASWGNETIKQLYATMRGQSVLIPGPETGRLCDYAKQRHITICIGVNERVESGPGNGTIYNSLLTIDHAGRIANHHRKLVPTFNERLFYGPGDGHGLQSVESSFGRIGGLICWEHWMPLARHALHMSGELIHVALWPSVHEAHQLASRHYAFEGRCFVVAVGQIMTAADFPAALQRPAKLQVDTNQMILNGGSCIIAPTGEFVLAPQFDRRGVIMHTLTDLDQVYRERMTLDVAGHYSRPDVFSFSHRSERPV